MENGILYIVATPISNLSDLTFRAKETLESVDVIWCEDTRQSAKLLSHFDIKKKTIGLHQHSSDEKIERLIGESLLQGKNIAYISDAGTPGISDPGGKIVELAIKNNIEVIPIPGASAVTTILSASGFPTDKFLFLGFMPHKGKTKIFQLINDSKITTIYYDSPHRVIKTLAEMKDFIDDSRQIIVGRELTKKFETIYRGTLSEVIEQVIEKQKGEFVVVVRGK